MNYSNLSKQHIEFTATVKKKSYKHCKSLFLTLIDIKLEDIDHELLQGHLTLSSLCASEKSPAQNVSFILKAPEASHHHQ